MNNLTLNKTYEYLEKEEIKVIDQMQSILSKFNRNASYKLYNSFQGNLKRTNKGFLFTITFAEHGQYVLQHKRRFTRKHPSKQAIEEIKKWIVNKGIPIGNGRIRTPMSKTRTTDDKDQLLSRTKAESNTLDKQRTSFAYAIWYSIRNNRRTKTPKTDFLKPYDNLFKSNSSFINGLKVALSEDGIKYIGTTPFDQIKIKL